ncbi:MAG: Flp family type IVb pilin [Acidimicrobiales bacterium]
MGSTISSGRDQRRFSGDTGASLVEYALLIALIAVVCIASLTYFQKETSASLSKSSSAITG